MTLEITYLCAWFIFCFVCIPALLVLLKKGPKKLYFMHPINTYGTMLERELSSFLTEFFCKWEIVNPNTQEHQDNYNRRKGETGNGMSYFEELATGCHSGVALAFRDGKLGAGVFTEMVSLLNKGCFVWVITFDKKMFFVKNVQQIKHLKLSVVETRARIRDKKGNRIPY